MDGIIKDIVHFLVGSILTAASAYAYQVRRENSALKTGLQALLRDRLIQSHDHFCALGHIPVYARQSIENCYQAYKGLGADGVIDDIMAEIRALPIVNKKG